VELWAAFVHDIWDGFELFIGIFDSEYKAEDTCRIFLKHIIEANPDYCVEQRYDYYYGKFDLNEFNLDALTCLM